MAVCAHVCAEATVPWGRTCAPPLISLQSHNSPHMDMDAMEPLTHDQASHGACSTITIILHRSPQPTHECDMQHIVFVTALPLCHDRR